MELSRFRLSLPGAGLSGHIAYVCASNYNLSDSATLDNHNFEVQGFHYGSGYGPGYGAVDADPSLVVVSTF